MPAPATAAPPPPPPGTMNDDLAPPLRIFLIVMLIIEILAVGLRFWSRSLMKPNQFNPRFWWDDWTILAALPFGIITISETFVMLGLGLGKHIWAISPASLSPLFKILFSVYFTYTLTMTFAKASVLLFYTRVFQRNQDRKWLKWPLWIAQGINVANLIIAIGISFGQCDPVAKNWAPMLPGHCNTAATWQAGAIISVILDLIILILPLPILWHLRLSRAYKIGVTFVFILGYSNIVISLGRLISITIRQSLINEDPTYEGIQTIYWLACENPILILGVCLPAMPNLGVRLMANVRRLTSNRSSSTDSNQNRGTDENHSLPADGGMSGNAHFYAAPSSLTYESGEKVGLHHSDSRVTTDSHL